MRLLKIVCSSLILTLPSLLAQGTELPGVRAAVDRVASALHLDGAGLSVARSHRELHRSLHGKVAADTVMPIASASKWLAVATILTLVDEGKLDLDLPVARYVEEFDIDEKRRVTLRQCLSCTSGLPARLGGRMRGWDMARFADEAADQALRAQPDTAFLYGGVGFQIVAVAAERVTGKDWHTLFAERIAGPLGMKNTKFGALYPIAADPGKTKLPWVAGGGVSTLNDYTRFVRMLLAKGEWHGQALLSSASVAEMLRDQVWYFIDVKSDAIDAKNLRYGLGTWIEPLAHGGVRWSDPGAFGFTPWIDAELDVCGVFAVKDRVKRVLRNLGRVHEAVRSAVMSPAIAGTAETVKLRHDGRDRHYHLHVPPHEQSSAGMPLLIVLHGDGGTGAQVREVTGLDKLGVQRGFIVAFPDGTGRLSKKSLAWNSGGVDAYASRHKVDDVGFLKTVVSDVQRKVPVDLGRVYVAGHSNGGMMSHRLAREAADVFQAIAVVAGAMNFTASTPTSPIAVMLIHGDKDKSVRIAGGRTGGAWDKKRVDASLADAVAYYVARNGLVAYPDIVATDGVSVATYQHGKVGTNALPVRVITLLGGGHAWPGTTQQSTTSSTRPHPWPASRRILEFFGSLHGAEVRNHGSPAVPR